MSAGVAIQRRVPARGIPSAASLRAWAAAATGARAGQITIRIVGAEESRRLNARYRGKNKPTNVLSFPYPELTGEGMLGDLVVCAPVVAREAREQGKPPRHHWAHMIVHGSLHLLGYDHIDAKDAGRMEARERAILARFDIPDPYLLEN
ncbi:MAG: rRNA maturation RNase YbeY [Gammaproteobacteria bacterium]|nr:rRNA maturation RNase YbeY [Gammaproteobacteria bacterium]